MWDIYEWYLLHHRGAVLRGMGTGVGLFVLWFAVLFFVFVGDTLIFVSPFLSYGGIANQNKMY